MNKKENEARELFSGTYNCCQSVLAALCSDIGIDKNTALSLGSGLGAGMCYQGRTCGAVVGAYLALGKHSGNCFEGAENIKENTFQLVSNFNKQFESEFNSTICKELLNIDISNPVGLEEAKDKGLFETKCPEFVAKAVQIAQYLTEKKHEISVVK